MSVLVNKNSKVIVQGFKPKDLNQLMKTLTKDLKVTEKFDFGAQTIAPTKVVASEGIPVGYESVDIGPESAKKFAEINFFHDLRLT